MNIFPVILVVHIISSVIWLGAFPFLLFLEKALNKAKGKPAERRLASFYLFVSNISGMIGMTGILLTGIALVFVLPYYSFFDFSSNHWLAAKQVIMVILAVMVFALIIPAGKKVRSLIGTNLDAGEPLADDFYAAYNKLSKVSLTANLLVLINFLLAITHRFF
jgi:Predicted integral membrane protein (DUF2269).